MAQTRDYEVPDGQPPVSVTPVPVAAPSPTGTIVAGAGSLATNGYILVKLVWEFWVMQAPYRMLSTDEFVILAIGLSTLANFVGNLYLFWRNRALGDYELRRDRKYALNLLKAQRTYPVAWLPEELFGSAILGLRLGSSTPGASGNANPDPDQGLLPRGLKRNHMFPGRDREPGAAEAVGERVEITTGPLPRDDVSAEGLVIPPH